MNKKIVPILLAATLLTGCEGEVKVESKPLAAADKFSMEAVKVEVASNIYHMKYTAFMQGATLGIVLATGETNRTCSQLLNEAHDSAARVLGY